MKKLYSSKDLRKEGDKSWLCRRAGLMTEEATSVKAWKRVWSRSFPGIVRKLPVRMKLKVHGKEWFEMSL